MTELPPEQDSPSDAAARPQGTPAGPETSKARGGCLKRLALFGGLTALALGIGGPRLLSSWVKGKVEQAGSDAINGRVTVGALSVRWNGKADIKDLVIEDDKGQLVARVPKARADVGLRSFLTGKKDVAVLVTGATLELVRSAEGSWNIEDLPRENRPEEDSEETESEPLPESPPDLEGRLEFLDTTVVIRSPDTVLELRDIDVRVGLDGDAREVTLSLTASLFGGEGSAGDFAFDGALWPDAGPGVRIDSAAVKGLDLGAVREALLLMGSPLEEGSRLEGKINLDAQGNVNGLTADSPFKFDAQGEAHDLVMDIRSGGLKTFAFGDPLATLNVSTVRAERAAEPRAEVSMRARGDKVAADVVWDGAAASGLIVDVSVDGLKASAGLEPLLARVHPVFATARAVKGANLDGLVSTNVAIEYGAPLPLEALKGGWAALDKEPFKGTGSLDVDQGLVETSPFFSKLLTAFDRPTSPSFDLKPLGFAVDAGRIAYAKPWTWTIQGTETSFVGSVGIDQTLDLKWVVPVTGGLAEQNRVLAELAGETFEVALGGSLTSPTFNLAGALTSLAKRAGERRIKSELELQKQRLQEKAKEALRKELEGKVGDGLEGKVEEILKGDPKKAIKDLIGGGGGGDGKKDAATLLKDADKLWGDGKKKEASLLYRKIRKEFPFSAVYLLNKKHVKSRLDG